MMAIEDAHDLSALAQAETIDAIEVLSGGAFAQSREVAILTAHAHLSAARQLLESGQRLPTRVAVQNALEHASRSLRSARAALANPSTLPSTYRN
jgi:hypothetical protein